MFQALRHAVVSHGTLLNSLRITLSKVAFAPGERVVALVELEFNRTLHLNSLEWTYVASTYQLARRTGGIRISRLPMAATRYPYRDNIYNISRVLERKSGVLALDRTLEAAVWQFDIPFRVTPHRPDRLSAHGKRLNLQLAVVADIANARDLRAWTKIPVEKPANERSVSDRRSRGRPADAFIRCGPLVRAPLAHARADGGRTWQNRCRRGPSAG